MPRSKPLMAAAIALVAVLGGVAVAIASPIGADGRVHFCISQQSLDAFQESGGAAGGGGLAVQAVNAGGGCPDDFPDPLVLGQTGPQGAPGPQGPQGTPGPQGVQGIGKPLVGQVADKLQESVGSVGKKADKTQDKVQAIQDAIDKLKDRKGDASGDAVAKQLQVLSQQVAVLTAQVEALSKVQVAIIAHLKQR